MRALQMLGFITTVVAFLSCYSLILPLNHQLSNGSSIAMMFMVTPLLGFSALILIPSSFALFNSKVRNYHLFEGRLWLCLWTVNSVLSVAYIGLMGYFFYLFVKS